MPKDAPWSPYANVEWGPSEVLSERRDYLAGLAVDTIAGMREIVDADWSRDPAARPEVDRLRSLLQYRAMWVAQDAVWQSLSHDDRTTLIAYQAKRGMLPTQEDALATIGIWLFIRASARYEIRMGLPKGAVMEIDSAAPIWGYFPDDIEPAGHDLIALGVDALL